MEARHARHALPARRRTHRRRPLLLVALLVVVLALLVLPLGRLTRGSSAEASPAGLLDPGADLLVTRCAVPFEGSAVVHFPPGSFDTDQLVHLTVADAAGWASGGGDLFPTTNTVVRVHVPAGSADADHPVAISAVGLREGTSAELHATFTVRVRCSDR